MSDNIFMGVILFIVGFFSGLLIGPLYWRQRRQLQVPRLQKPMNKGEQSWGETQAPSQERDRSSLLIENFPTNKYPAAKIESDPDDLKRIEGIGPKISGLLNEAGIRTFSQLAASSDSQLVKIVRGAGISIADPGTWPEQANLAAEGDWNALTDLQESLKGGRRV